MSKSLFLSNIGTKNSLSEGKPKIRTPLGEVLFSIKVNGKDVASQFVHHPSLRQGESLFRYESGELTSELVIFHSNVELLPHQKIEDCLTCTLRLISKVNDLCCQFSAVLKSEVKLGGGGDTGENLAAMTWENPQFTVSLGAGDIDWYYLMAGKLYPLRWKKLLSEQVLPPFTINRTAYFVEQLEQHGLCFNPPELMTREACQLSFAVAWANYTEDDISAWTAVDQAHEFIRNNFLPFQPEALRK